MRYSQMTIGLLAVIVSLAGCRSPVNGPIQTTLLDQSAPEQVQPLATTNPSQEPAVADPATGRSTTDVHSSSDENSAGADDKLMQLIQTTDDPVAKRVLAAQLSTATAGSNQSPGSPVRRSAVDDVTDQRNVEQIGDPSNRKRDELPIRPTGNLVPQIPQEQPIDAASDNPEDKDPSRDSVDRGFDPFADNLPSGQQIGSASRQVVDRQARSRLTDKSSNPGSIRQSISTDEREPDGKTWPKLVEETIQSLHEELDELPDADQSDKAKRVELEVVLRLLYLIADQRENAVRPIKQLPQAEREFWKEQVYGVMVYLNNEEMPITERRMTLALGHLRRAAEQLATISDLEVRNVSFCERVDSYGVYAPFANDDFRPEQQVLLYVEVENFSPEQRSDSGEYETALQGSYEIRDLAQLKVAEHSFLLETEVCRNRRRDFFIPYRMYMPSISPGQYTLQVTMEDTKSNRIGQSVPIRFTIRQ